MIPMDRHYQVVGASLSGKRPVDDKTYASVAVLSDGSRLVDTVRTEAASLAPFVEVPVVQVAATVTDGGGKLVKGLRRDAFRVFENDREQEITHFIGADSERELVVAVDMSASMGPAMATCRDAVHRFLGTRDWPENEWHEKQGQQHRCGYNSNSFDPQTPRED